MSGRLAVVALVAALAVPPAAGAQSAIDVAGAPGAKTTTASATLTGGLTVSFRSDPATCAAVGRCGLEGTVAWHPQRRAQLALLATGRRLDAYLLSLGSENG